MKLLTPAEIELRHECRDIILKDMERHTSWYGEVIARCGLMDARKEFEIRIMLREMESRRNTTESRSS